MPSKHQPPWILIVTTFSVAIAAILMMTLLRRSADRSLETSVSLAQFQNVLTQLDGLDSESFYSGQVSNESLETITKLNVQAGEILQTLPQDSDRGVAFQQCRSLYERYWQALNQILRLRSQQKLDQARELDEQQVDPTFEKLSELVSRQSQMAVQQVKQTDLISDRGAVVIILLAASVISIISDQIQRSRQRAETAQTEQAISQAREATLEAERALLAQRVAERTQELDQKNQDLSQALAQLTSAQVELVQAEKMATLGQLVAGIAHEINTPLGAVQASTGNSLKALQGLLENFPHALATLPEGLQTSFLALLRQCLVPNPSLTSMEKRPLRSALGQQLIQADLPSHAAQIDRLLDMGVRPETVADIFPVLQSDQRDWMMTLAYNINRLQHNSNTIRVAVERAGKIVFALKNYAHQDQSPHQKQLASLTEGLETVLELFHNLLKRGIEVERHYQELPLIPCYVDELMQVWTNLIHNAIQAMAGKGTLTIATQLEADMAWVRITNTGPEISDELKSKIFEPFFTTKSRGEGSGLGLSICQQIISKHGGQLSVDSNPEHTTFSVALPLHTNVTDSLGSS